MGDHASFWGVGLVFVGVIGAAAVIFQLSSSGGQKNVSTVSTAGTSVVGDMFSKKA